MKLPHRQSAYIPASKLTGYLLSHTHVTGKTKARFFQQVGFDEKNVDVLERELKKIAQECEITEKISMSFGEKYIVDGVIKTPTGRAIHLRTVWIVEKGENNPRFVTAYPG